MYVLGTATGVHKCVVTADSIMVWLIGAFLLSYMETLIHRLLDYIELLRNDITGERDVE